MITDFYLGNGTDSDGKSIHDYLNNDNLDSGRAYVPWVFPSTESSSAYPDVPLLNQELVESIKNNTQFIEMVKKVVNHYLKFLSVYTGWLNSANHHHHRITRMIKFLSLIELKEEAVKVSEWCCSHSGASKKIKNDWMQSASFVPSWNIDYSNKKDS